MVHTKIGAGALHLIFVLCFHILTTTATNTNNGRATGFSLELIHRDSKRSLYYTSNLTDDERYERLHKLSDARLQWFKSSSLEKANLKIIRPPVRQSLEGLYMVAVRIGTGSGMENYFLWLDTASALTWTQCQPCNPCFDQVGRIFEPKLSKTYMHVPCEDPLCKQPFYKCVNNVCTYRAHYDDKSYAIGTLSRETFGFQAAGRSRNFESVANLAFGCSDKNHMRYTDHTGAGILGMNGDPESFAVQLAGLTNGLFSYCLAPQKDVGVETNSGYLRFGSDIPTRAGVQQTPLQLPQGDANYFVNLLDISVGNNRLNLDPRMFERRGIEKGGVIIDSGSGITHMVMPAFVKAKMALQTYFMRHHRSPVIPGKGTCFSHYRGVEKLFPTMTFHFQGANLEVPGIHMFHYEDGGLNFCWSVEMDDEITIIGAAQQINKRFIFDLKRRVLSFASEDCARDAR